MYYKHPFYHDTPFTSSIDSKAFLYSGYEWEDLAQYDDHFTLEERILLSQAGCLPEEASEYGSYIPGRGVVALYEANIGAEEFREYMWALQATGKKSLMPGCRSNEGVYTDEIPELVIDHIIDLALAGVDADKAGAYDENPEDIIDLFDAGLDPEKYHAYDSSLGIKGIIRLYENNIDEKTANQFSDRFSARDIVTLVKNEVPFEEVHKYPKGYQGNHIARVWNQGLSYEDCILYDERFTPAGVSSMIEAGCDWQTADMYNGFTGNEIAMLFSQGITPEVVESYEELFTHGSGQPMDAKSLIKLHKKGVGPEALKAYDHEEIQKRLHSKNQLADSLMEWAVKLSCNDIDTVMLSEFSPDFSIKEIMYLCEKHVPPDFANEYYDHMIDDFVGPYGEEDGLLFRFYFLYDIVNAYNDPMLFYPGVRRVTVEHFISRIGINDLGYDGEKIMRFLDDEYKDFLFKLLYDDTHLCQLGEYSDDFSFTWRLVMLDNGLSETETVDYVNDLISRGFFDKHKDTCFRDFRETWKNFFSPELPEYICQLIKSATPDHVAAYNPLFMIEDILALVGNEISPEIANSYVKIEDIKTNWNHCEYLYRFEGNNILRLIEAGCGFEQASEYNPKLKAHDIAALYYVGICEENGFEVNSNEFLDFARDILKFKDIKKFREQYSFLNRGGQGVILTKDYGSKKRAWKYSKNIEKEYEFLKRLSRSRNIINAEYLSTSKKFIRLEYLEGETLEEKISKQEHRTLECGKGIVDAIYAMHSKGVYHRDLHDRNIMIDDGRIKVIDMGSATEDPSEVHTLNRAYGGNNDLISLGQLLYKMETGRNLFNESEEFTFYSEVKKGVSTVREMTYDDPSLLDGLFGKVRNDVRPELADLIVFLLEDDLWRQPSLEKVVEVCNRLSAVQ